MGARRSSLENLSVAVSKKSISPSISLEITQKLKNSPAFEKSRARSARSARYNDTTAGRSNQLTRLVEAAAVQFNSILHSAPRPSLLKSVVETPLGLLILVRTRLHSLIHSNNSLAGIGSEESSPDCCESFCSPHTRTIISYGIRHQRQ